MAEQVLNQFWSDKMTRVEAKAIIDEMRQETADLPEMTLEEINAEIRAVREEST